MSQEAEDPVVTMICERSFRVSPARRLSLDLRPLVDQLADSYDVTDRKSSIIIKVDEAATMTLMSTGSGLVQGVEDEEQALSIYNHVLSEATTSGKLD
jgi:hypothetical protein